MKRSQIISAMEAPPETNRLAYIPTAGLPTTAVDFYRVHHFESQDYIADNPLLVMYYDSDHLSIFQDEIMSFDSLLMFESQLRGILLHDVIDILIPSIKYLNTETKTVHYKRLGEFRKESTLNVLHSIGCHDLIFPSELLTIKDKIIIASSKRNSDLVEQNFDNIQNLLLNEKNINHLSLNNS